MCHKICAFIAVLLIAIVICAKMKKSKTEGYDHEYMYPSPYESRCWRSRTNGELGDNLFSGWVDRDHVY